MSRYVRTLIGLACAALALGIVVGCKAEKASTTSTSPSSATPIPVGSTAYSMSISGLTRSYHVYRPAGITSAAHIDGPPVQSVIATWRQIDGCAQPSSSTSGVVTTSVASCPDGRAVELITVAGAGHQWPGSPDRPLIQKMLGLDTPSTALNATDVVWSFFAAHP